MIEVSIVELLDDFKAIKLSKSNRVFVNECRGQLQYAGDLPYDKKRQLRTLARYHHRSLKELREARARARKTNGLKQMGLTMREASKLAAEKRVREDAAKADTGL